LVEEAAAASKSMDEQANGLSELVAFFNTGDNNTVAKSSVGERRSRDERPWTEEPQSAPEPAVKEQKRVATAGSSDEEWEDF